MSQEHDWPISVLCQISGITRDAYYKWLHRKPSNYKVEQSELLEAILEYVISESSHKPSRT
ncbi:hypothetical protein CBF96_02765 [Limosilactobacillus reuteri]|uniref:IS3 family transposase n=1 Tax=Limosilactobacillus reuteri TaxID=1598 RepID=A0A256SU20_LIMRT|nr:hypothetical protein CBF96_02765 [Limosilactobacillus reuteri]